MPTPTKNLPKHQIGARVPWAGIRRTAAPYLLDQALAILLAALASAAWFLLAPLLVAFSHAFRGLEPEDQSMALLVLGLAACALYALLAPVNGIRRRAHRSAQEIPFPAVALPVHNTLTFKPQRAGRLRLCKEFKDAAYADWVIARNTPGTPDEELLDYARRWWPAWKESTASPVDERQAAGHEAAHSVVAHALGFTVTSASIVPGADGSGGRVNTVNPVPSPGIADESWRRMAVLLAGRTADLGTGRANGGSTSDVARALAEAAVILSSGLRPKGHTGPLTSDALLTSAASNAREILEQHQAAVTAITAHLLHRRTLDAHDLRPLLPSTDEQPGGSETCAADSRSSSQAEWGL